MPLIIYYFWYYHQFSITSEQARELQINKFIAVELKLKWEDLGCWRSSSTSTQIKAVVVIVTKIKQKVPNLNKTIFIWLILWTQLIYSLIRKLPFEMAPEGNNLKVLLDEYLQN